MAGRRLHPDEEHLWAQVARTVRPLVGKRAPVAVALPAHALPDAAKVGAKRTGPVGTAPPTPSRRPADYLDNSWERKISGGRIVPDISIDLHGHTLDTAHRHLNTALAAAVMKGARVLLVVTGKPRTGHAPPGERARGAIRAEIGHWLATSPHADAIASVRNAHPRHGGSGALYIILRRGN